MSVSGALCMRWLLCSGMLLLAALGCGRKATPATVSTAAPTRAEEPGSAPRGEIAGVRYLEHMTGDARPEERVPMIVALHPMDADPADFLQLLQRYRRRARLILPYGHPSGGMFRWYDAVGDDAPAAMVTREADRIAAALDALVVARPTVGKPIVTGFSQGGIMTFALAVTHPEALSAAFPISGLLPSSLYPSAALSSVTLPPVAAFHGASDLAVPTRAARASIAELQRVGYAAELREYAGVEHDISAEELGEILERIGRAADSLAPAP